jgi:hypothetical protein
MTVKPESDLPLSGVTENGQFKINLWWDNELKSGQKAVLYFDVLDTFLKDRPVATSYDLKVFHEGRGISETRGMSLDSKTQSNSYEFLIPEDVSGIINIKFEKLSDSSVANLEIPLIVDRKDSTLEYQIPDWIKNNAGWWADGQIPDSAFVDGIEFLIKEEIIVVPVTDSQSESESSIPDWIKTNAGWWADGQIDDKTFATGIEFLIKIGLIVV